MSDTNLAEDSETRYIKVPVSKKEAVFLKKMKLIPKTPFLIHFVLAGSQFSSSSSTILATFNEKIASGDVNALKSLIDSNSEYITNPSAMYYRNLGFLTAVQESRAPVVELLLKNANVDAAALNNKAIRLTSTNGDVEIAKMLLARPEVNPGALGNEALVVASKNGHTEIVRLLLEHPKVDPAIGGDHASFWASSMNHGEIVKLLINDERAYPTIVKIFTIEQAARYGNVDLVRFLLSYPSINRISRYAFITGHLVSIKTMVEAGYKFDQETLKRTLQRVRSSGNEDIVKYLESLRNPRKLPVRDPIIITEQCAICLSDQNLLQGYLTSCNHQFHEECLQKWISLENSCPLCRSPKI